MSDLAALARDTERFLDPPPFELMIAARRRGRRRGVLRASGAAVAALLAVSLLVAGLGWLGGEHRSAQALPGLLPEWTADEIVGHPDAFVVRQLSSHSYPPRVLRVWKRCASPTADHDCLGREAIAVTDDDGHRLTALGAATGSSEQPDLGDDGLFREVEDGVWYWAHRSPGPALFSATMDRPAELTFRDRAVTHAFGVPGIECPDRVGVCTLDTAARTIDRLARPDVPDSRWSTPTPAGCGLWALAGTGGNLRLVIQQRDGSFATADIPDDDVAAMMAEGGPDCEVAYYQAVAGDRFQLVVSLDQGRTWSIHRAPVLEVAGLVEKEPRPRTLIPPQWQALPSVRDPLDPPGSLQPLGCGLRPGCAGTGRSAGR
ncbi:hypothetical protein [Intrasporangium sp. YIM S08009]|uniref:hypothetical protein n=1 Tax=Intrasporangium zincisolvens TaxID=3080018 RepID=UPI002B058411|nr:hypothetical protein [Intrasporangium sp. YIM S08009]